MSSMKMWPSEIRFSQNNINDTFTGGEAVHDIIDQISLGQTSTSYFLPISVAFHKGHLYAENNRSLYVFRVLEYEGETKEIAVKIVNANTIWRLMSTRNEGTSVTMRNGVPTRPHSIQQILDIISSRLTGSRLTVSRHSVSSVTNTVSGSGWNTAWKVGACFLAVGVAIAAAVASAVWDT